MFAVKSIFRTVRAEASHRDVVASRISPEAQSAMRKVKLASRVNGYYENIVIFITAPD